MTDAIFANHFWGLKDDGYYILTAKMNNNKKTYDEIKSFYNIRASLHEEFGRKLMKHAKSSIGREEIGTLHTLLKSAHEEMERNAQAHIDLGHKLKSVLEVYLDNFILEQKDKKKLTQTNVEKAHRYKQSSETYLSKVKEKYESDCAKLITLQTQIGSVSGREVEKIKQKIEKTQQEIKLQEQEYKTACKKLADATKGWNETWKAACDTYQIMEKQRLEFLHHSFSMYINILSTGTHEDQESYERFWKSLDNYDPCNDIERFISDKGTGSKIPEAETFIDYMDDPSKSLPQYTIANFSTPPELIVSDSPVKDKEFTLPDLEDEDEFVISEDTIPERKAATVQKPLPAISIKQKPHTISEERPVRKQSQEKHLIEPEEGEPLTFTQQPLQYHKSVPQQPLQYHNSLQQQQSLKYQKSMQEQPLQYHNSLQQQIVQQRQQRNSAQSQQSPHQSNLQHQTSIQPKHPQQLPPLYSPVKRQSTIPIATPSLPEMEETSSTTDTSDEEPEKKDDVSIDPRANVVLAIGNNMFNLGHLDLQEYNVKRRRSADIEAACNFSYQGLLEEIGVYKSNNDKERVVEEAEYSADTGNKNTGYGDSADTGIKEANDEEYHQPATNGIKEANDEEYYKPVTLVDNATPPSSPKQTILFWGITLTDWKSGKPEDLQFSKGTYLGIVEVRPNGWYYAIKFDSKLNQLTNEIGFVASSIVKVCS